MKKITTKFFAIALLLVMMGCSKDEEDQQQQNPNNDKISATINGEAWEAEIQNTAITGGSMQLYAMKPDDTGITIFITEDTVGTFEFPSMDATVSYSEGSVFWSNNMSGSITVDHNNSNRVSGSFNTVTTSAFTTDTLVIQNGTFNWEK